jgi:hypothetical protein
MDRLVGSLRDNPSSDLGSREGHLLPQGEKVTFEAYTPILPPPFFVITTIDGFVG